MSGLQTAVSILETEFEAVESVKVEVEQLQKGMSDDGRKNEYTPQALLGKPICMHVELCVSRTLSGLSAKLMNKFGNRQKRLLVEFSHGFGSCSCRTSA